MTSGRSLKQLSAAQKFRRRNTLQKCSGCHVAYFVFLLAVTFDSIVCEKYTPEFDDKHAFEISWLGPDTQSTILSSLQNLESIVMNTKDKESYRCFLPKIGKSNGNDKETSRGPKAEDLLSGILTLKGTKCSYRLEPYWTYEVCHGLHVRQFHEEKVPGQEKPKVQEYFLGKVITEDPGEAATDDKKANEKQETESVKIPKKEIDGRLTPYFNFTMDNGTPCDIKHNKPRRVDILYICHATANNEVFSVKETTTCEYEVIILTPELCHNPAYLMKDNPVNGIHCLPLEGAPSRPSRIADSKENSLEEENISAEIKHTTWMSDSTPESVKNEDSGEREKQSVEQKSPVEKRKKATTSDDQLTKDFLSGEYCLQGGSGWWLYEFCYGKYVQQFHQEPSGKTMIYLGYWDKKKHEINHFYTGIGGPPWFVGQRAVVQLKLHFWKWLGIMSNVKWGMVFIMHKDTRFIQ
ncbi:endoplasmic reticulum lectin 1-like isoform X2 [Rhopilema esculentum]|uniref:endoplasmic reticulum lectin 1-like isoform X2 n=1 Tax=Rhopilema esculentum TaxID=499914 RepID=UPI0031D81421